MIPVYREDLPRATTVWTCDACVTSSCEMTVRSGSAIPSLCPCGMVANWRKRE